MNNKAILESTQTTSLTAYTSGDVIGASKTVIPPVRNKRFKLERIRIIDTNDIKAPIDVYLTNSLVTVPADNAALAATAAMVKAVIASIVATNAQYVDEGPTAWVEKDVSSLNLIYDGPIHYFLVCRGAPTYTEAEALTLQFIGEYV